MSRSSLKFVCAKELIQVQHRDVDQLFYYSCMLHALTIMDEKKKNKPQINPDPIMLFLAMAGSIFLGICLQITNRTILMANFG